MATRNIQAFRLRSELIVDASKHHSEYAKAEKEVTTYGATVKKTGKEIAAAFDSAGAAVKKTGEQVTAAFKGAEGGAKAGAKFGKEFGASAVSSITGSISALGTTLGGVIGTAIAPGIGTAIGSTIGSGLDAALGKVAGPLLETINKGIELNKVIEDTRVEFTQMTGSTEEANKYLADMLGISKDLGILPQTVIQTSEELSDLTGSLKTTNLLLKAAADQAADFSGTDFHTVAINLAQIAEQATITEKQIRSLMKASGGGIADAKKYLAEATGKTEEQIAKLLKAGRIRGEQAAQIIALGIERDKGGLAGYKTAQTVSGRERQFGALTQIRAAEGTQQATRALGDFYAQANAVLDSPQAKAFTGFINDFSGKLIDFTEGALKAGVSVGAGVAQGLLSFDAASLMQSMTKLGDFVITGLETVFEIGSPSQLSAREIGVPLGEGLGVGLVKGLNEFIKGKGGQEIVDTLRSLLQDPRVQALLNTLIKAEGGSMDIMAGGRHVASGAKHPGEVVPRSQWMVSPGTGGKRSSAAGLLQETLTNWKAAEAIFGPLNFSSAEDQKLVALWLMAGHQGGLGILKSGTPQQMMGLAAKDWTSTPGSKIGGGGQKSSAWWLGQFQSNLAAGGGSSGFSVNSKPVDKSNPMPVVVMQDLQGGAALAFGPRPRADAGVEAKISLGQMTQSLDELPKAFVEVTGAMEALTTKSVEETMATTMQMRATAAVTPVAERSAAEIAALTEQMDALGANAIVGAGKLSTFAATLGQVSGQIGGAFPQQQVSKKRGLFSKILGIAAPFLSFIPGVGPILSTIAGAASGFVGGDIGAGISSIAGGFSAGGAFRGKSGGGGGGIDVSSLGEAPPPRQFGGPAYGGRPYLVGERGPELFVPGQDGQVHPGGELAGVLEGLRQEIGRLGSMPPEHVVMKGARGLNRAMDSDASLMEGYGRRLRLA
jgi:muramidase (phage lysozyme)